jgi:MFS family permease
LLIRVKSAYRDSNVLRWLVAYTASSVGDSSYFLTLGWAASKVVGPAQVGLVLAVGAVPRALLMLGGGVFADRFGPRKVVIGSDALRCLVIVVVAADLAFTSPGLWLLIAVALVFGVVDALFMPAVGSLPPLISDPGQAVQIQGMRAFAVRVGNSVGPPVAGLAIGLGSPALAFGMAGGLFALSFVLLLSVRIGRPAQVLAEVPGARPRAWRDLKAGLLYSRSNKLIATLVLSMVLVELGSMAPLSVGILLLVKTSGWGPSAAGIIIGAFGAGAGASAMLLSTMRALPRSDISYAATSVFGAIGIGLIVVASRPFIAIFLAAFAGVALGLNGTLAYVFVQAVTKPEFLGRVMSLLSLVSFGLGPMSYPLYGIGVTAWGARPMFVVCAVIGMFAAVVAVYSLIRGYLPRQLGSENY